MFTGLVSTQCRTRLLFERAAMKLVWLRGFLCCRQARDLQ